MASTKKKLNKQCFLKLFFTQVSRLFREEAIALHAAALTFFAIFSFLPLLLLTYIAFDKLSEGVAIEFLFTTQEAIGAQATNNIIEVVKQFYSFKDHWFVYAIGIILILYATTRFMYFLKKSMNHLWRVPTPKKWIHQEIRHRIISTLSIFILSFLSTIIVLQKASMISIQRYLGPQFTSMVYYLTLTLAIYSIMSIIYKIIPDKKIEWSDVILGSVFTTILFWGSFFAIRAILRKSFISTIYGAISGVLLILLWTYYFAEIIYIGAEITKVYATFYGSMKNQKRTLLDPIKKEK